MTAAEKAADQQAIEDLLYGITKLTKDDKADHELTCTDSPSSAGEDAAVAPALSRRAGGNHVKTVFYVHQNTSDAVFAEAIALLNDAIASGNLTATLTAGGIVYKSQVSIQARRKVQQYDGGLKASNDKLNDEKKDEQTSYIVPLVLAIFIIVLAGVAVWYKATHTAKVEPGEPPPTVEDKVATLMSEALHLDDLEAGESDLPALPPRRTTEIFREVHPEIARATSGFHVPNPTDTAPRDAQDDAPAEPEHPIVHIASQAEVRQRRAEKHRRAREKNADDIARTKWFKKRPGETQVDFVHRIQTMNYKSAKHIHHAADGFATRDTVDAPNANAEGTHALPASDTVAADKEVDAEDTQAFAMIPDVGSGLAIDDGAATDFQDAENALIKVTRHTLHHVSCVRLYFVHTRDAALAMRCGK